MLCDAGEAVDYARDDPDMIVGIEARVGRIASGSMGMDLTDVLRTVTSAPAQAIGRPQLGSLQLGAVGDAAMLELREGRFKYVGSPGQRMLGERRLVATAR